MRFFLLDHDRIAPDVGDVVRLAKQESHHLLRVMRTRPGDSVRLSDGRGRFFDTILLDGEEDVGAAGGLAGLKVSRIVLDEVEAGAPRLVLACAVVKGRRFEWALEKAVELGVHEIRPLVTGRSVVKPRPGRGERWRSVLRAAVKQSGRSWVPDIVEPVDTGALLAARDPGDVVYFGDTSGLAAEQGTRHVPDMDQELERCADGDPGRRPDQLVFVVGPEGGWSESEQRQLETAGRPVCLGPHRLRTETAAVAGMVFLQAVRCRWLRRADDHSAGS